MGRLLKSFGVAQGDFWPQDYRIGIDDPVVMSGSVLANRLAGSNVTPDSAYGLPAFLAVVHVLSEDMAKLPLKVYRKLKPRGKEPAPDHWAYGLLHDVPNPEMTSFVWRETMMGHLLTWGNCFSEIVRNGLGEVVELWPLRPDRMEVRRDTEGVKYYRYRLVAEGFKDLRAGQVFHVPGLSYDGLVGYSPVTLLRHAIGLGLAAQTYGEQMWNNGARPGLILTVPQDVRMTEDAASRLKTQVDSAHAGLSNAQRTMVLKDGISVHEIGIPPEDAQYIETRKFQLDEIARVYRIPQHKVGDLERSTNNNIEQQALEYVQDALGGYIGRWESQIRKDILADPDYFAEFNVDSLLRADSVARAQSLHLQRIDGIISADEWRDIENRNPIPDGGGEAYWQPLNMTPVGEVPLAAIPDLLRTPGTENPLAPGAPPVADTVPVVPTQPSRNGHPNTGPRKEEKAVSEDGSISIRLPVPIVNFPEQPAPVVNVEAPSPVVVPAPVVNVPPPDMAPIAAAIATLDKPTEKLVERDSAGKITRVVERRRADGS